MDVSLPLVRLTGTDKAVTANRLCAPGGTLKQERVLSGGTVSSSNKRVNKSAEEDSIDICPSEPQDASRTRWRV